MFAKPEELITAILGVVWVIITYFLAEYATAASTKYTLMITAFTALWTIGSFFIWRAERWIWLWPIVLGALVACWWPWLDWFTLRHIVAVPDASMLVITKPWYASWSFKIILSMLPIVIGYGAQWRKHRRAHLL